MPLLQFLHRSTPRYPTIRQALVKAGVPAAAEPARLTVLERMGSYSGRRVNFFRAFDPSGAAIGSVQVRAFHDLDAHQDLVLGSGHVEHDGLVMLDERPGAEGPAPSRSPADRGTHADDERFVFQHGAGSLLAAPPATS